MPLLSWLEKMFGKNSEPANPSAWYPEVLKQARDGNSCAVGLLVLAQIAAYSRQDSCSALRLIYNQRHHEVLFRMPAAVREVILDFDDNSSMGLWRDLSELAKDLQGDRFSPVYASQWQDTHADLKKKLDKLAQNKSKFRDSEAEEIDAFKALYAFFSKALDLLGHGSAFPDVKKEARLMNGELPRLLEDVVNVLKLLAGHRATDYRPLNPDGYHDLKHLSDSIGQLETPVERRLLQALVFEIWLLEDMPNDKT